MMLKKYYHVNNTLTMYLLFYGIFRAGARVFGVIGNHQALTTLPLSCIAKYANITNSLKSNFNESELSQIQI